ncbi:AMIN domain-containing protein [Nostoc sp. MG11]|uniref:AMIN domain-containing protein n=1 Tax=Nostoc sp. MG11 TaxID=2721166 RepID=UPI001867C90B|nr:AMIN domain-containing protein [Nostoc sp. MG11]
MDKGLKTRKFFQWYKQLFGVSLFSLYVTIALETVSSAATPVAKLDDWRFYPEKVQLEITLSAGTTPRYFYLAQPPRIVLDLPDTQLGYVSTQQNYSGAIQRIRVSQLNASSTRIVLDLAPSTSLHLKQLQLQRVSQNNSTRWVLRPVTPGYSTSVQPVYSSPSPNNLPQIPHNYSQPSSNLPLTTTNAQPPLFTLPPPSSDLPQTTNPQQPFVTVPPLAPNQPSQLPNSILPPATFPNQPGNLNSITPLNQSEFPVPTTPNNRSNDPNIEVIEFGQPLPKTRY